MAIIEHTYIHIYIHTSRYTEFDVREMVDGRPRWRNPGSGVLSDMCRVAPARVVMSLSIHVRHVSDMFLASEGGTAKYALGYLSRGYQAQFRNRKVEFVADLLAFQDMFRLRACVGILA